MKITDLIKQLEEIQDQHGDLELYSGHYETWHFNVEEVFVQDNGYGIIRGFVK